MKTILYILAFLMFLIGLALTTLTVRTIDEEIVLTFRVGTAQYVPIFLETLLLGSLLEYIGSIKESDESNVLDNG